MPNQKPLNQVQEVEKFYQKFPYPGYPLLAKPRIAEGTIGLSLVVAQLAALHGVVARVLTEGCPQILCVGCGEIQPYVLRSLEPKHHFLHCVDLSQRSLLRARVRVGLARKIRFFHTDIVQFLKETDSVFDHIDAYGVLHHLEDPEEAIKALTRRSRDGTTMRVMVYNSYARDWIHRIQSQLRWRLPSIPGIKSVSLAREYLESLTAQDDELKAKLAAVGKHTLKSSVRFADMFLHPLEQQWSLSRWMDVFEKHGWQLFALFDRYGELDHLPNPLWQVPSLAVLQEAVEQRSFENNFELFLYKGENNRRVLKDPHLRILNPLTFYAPPKHWFQFSETRDLKRFQRQRIWNGFRALVFGKQHRFEPSFLAGLPEGAIDRLTRLGALFPRQLSIGEGRGVSGPLL